MFTLLPVAAPMRWNTAAATSSRFQRTRSPGGHDAARVYFTPCGNGKYGLYALGGASAGDNGIESGPDTLFAGVGDPRNAASGMTDVLIEPNQPAAGSLRLTFSSVTMEANTGPTFPRIASNVKYRVLVYPTAAAASADPQRTGVGAVFNGTVDLHARGGSGSARFATGDFSNAEWDLADTGTLATVTPTPGLQKVISGLANPANAVVVQIADPKTGISAGIPGFSWPALLLLSLGLLGSGLWVIRSRRTVATA